MNEAMAVGGVNTSKNASKELQGLIDVQGVFFEKIMQRRTVDEFDDQAGLAFVEECIGYGDDVGMAKSGLAPALVDQASLRFRIVDGEELERMH
jgi:hypothetical protein